MRSRERAARSVPVRPCLAAIATQWHTPLAAHMELAGEPPGSGPLLAAAGTGTRSARSVSVSPRSRVDSRRTAGGSRVGHPPHPMRVLRRQPGPGEGICESCDRASGTDCLGARLSVPVSPRLAAIAPHRWRLIVPGKCLTRGPPGAGPLRALRRPQPA
jgi:hypothetical protein